MQTGTTYVDLEAVVEYQGTVEGGQNVLNDCTSNATRCTNGSPAQATGGFVKQTTQESSQLVGAVTLTQQTTPVGEPFSFVSTYSVGGAATESTITLGQDPANALECVPAKQGVGAYQFTCYPLREDAVVTVTAYGFNPQDTAHRVSSSVTVFNTCKGWVAGRMLDSVWQATS